MNEFIEQVDKLRKQGLTLKEVAGEVGLQHKTLWQRLKRAGYVWEKNNTNRNKYYEDNINKIILMYQEDQLSASQIGSVLGKSESQVLVWLHKADVPLRRAPNKPIEKDGKIIKICTTCTEEKPLSQFAERYDRKGKYYSECKSCRSIKATREYHQENKDKIRLQKAEYRRTNPESHREHSRKRRALKAGARTEKVTENQIRMRDGDECGFCGNFVDSKLKWPDPMSTSLNHIHPLNKRGPNNAKNLSLAHLGCNAAAKDTYVSPFISSDWRVQPISYVVAREAIIRHHYLHRSCNITYSFGLFYQDTLMGVATFGSPSHSTIAKSICPSNPKLVKEFSRLWIDDSAPFGAASWFVSRALKLLPELVIVSFADHNVGHTGGVYKALNFHYANETALNGESSSKSRFWILTGTKAQRKKNHDLITWPILPYI